MAKITGLNVAFENTHFYPGGEGGGGEKCGMKGARGSADHSETQRPRPSRLLAVDQMD